MVNKIICSAILTKEGIIVRGHRHSHCIMTAKYMGITPKGVKYQGFIDSNNEYRTREEAYVIHLNSGEEPAEGEYCQKGKLFSEDLYKLSKIEQDALDEYIKKEYEF